MQVAKNISLVFIDLLQLDNWSVQTLLDSKVHYSNRFELAKIGEFLIKDRTSIDIEDDKIYRRVKVKINNNGVTLRDTEKGVNIGTKKQFIAKLGQFIISKIDARNGAFGVIPDELEGAIVTNDFPLFNVNKERINPQFLLLITTTKEFIKFAQSCSSGTTNRQRMDVDLFLNQKIPLPSMEEQNEIINNYNKKIKEAHDLAQQAKDLEGEIEKYLFDALGIEYKIGENIKKGLQTIEYAKVEKWSIEDIFKKNSIQSNKYNLITLNSLCTLITDGTHQTPTYYKDGVIFLSAKNVTKKVINWDNVKYVSRNAHNEYCIRVKPEVGDILLAKNGTTGVGAIVDKDIEFSIYVSLALLKPKKDMVNSTFLLYLINSKIAKMQFNSRLIGIGVPNLHLGEIKEVVIPLPPLEEQNSIVKRISKMTENINITNSNIDLLQQQAEQDFERAIFN